MASRIGHSGGLRPISFSAILSGVFRARVRARINEDVGDRARFGLGVDRPPVFVDRAGGIEVRLGCGREPSTMTDATGRQWTRESILARVREILVDSFELDPAAIGLESHLIDDLDLDSIDAIDLAVGLEEETGLHVDEKELRQIRVVGDVVDLVCQRLAIQ